MKEIQILKEFQRRTEYQILSNWLTVQPQDVEQLKPGVCLLPGILLTKISPEHIEVLIQWSQEWGNQLILVAPWFGGDLQSFLNLTTEVLILEQKANFQGIPVTQILQTKVPPLWKSANGDCVAIKTRYHTGSGVLIVTTVPLLDYKLIDKEEQCRVLLAELWEDIDQHKAKSISESCNDKSGEELSNDHLFALTLAAAGININDNMAKKVRENLTIQLVGEESKIREELLRCQMINDQGTATVKGTKYLEQKGYRSFVRELSKRGEICEW